MALSKSQEKLFHETLVAM